MTLLEVLEALLAAPYSCTSVNSCVGNQKVVTSVGGELDDEEAEGEGSGS